MEPSHIYLAVILMLPKKIIAGYPKMAGLDYSGFGTLFKPFDWGKMLCPNLWADAASQIIFSLGTIHNSYIT